jgi:hypothetical protein
MILQSARHPLCPLCQLSRSRLRAVVKLGNASTIQINVINLATSVYINYNKNAIKVILCPRKIHDEIYRMRYIPISTQGTSNEG